MAEEKFAADPRLFVALDVPTTEDAIALAEKLGDSVVSYKVGMELYYRSSGDILTWLKEHKKHIFLDLKLHDIPNTVANGLLSLMHYGVDILNVHASGGYTMMKTAVDRVHEEAKKRGIPAPKLIAVTILTSIGDEDWAGLGQKEPIRDMVLRLAKLAKKAGMDGVVASPQEAAAIREVCGDDFLIITPGIRPADAETQDQQRIATPSAALRNGATHLVVGRPIRLAEDPREAAIAITKEMEEIK